ACPVLRDCAGEGASAEGFEDRVMKDQAAKGLSAGVSAPFRALALMLGMAIVACNPSTAENGLQRFATGELEDLQIMAEPPAQPTIMFLNEAGDRITLDQFRGKVLVLNLWATWCAPCVKEMPSLDRLRAELGSDRLEVVSI